MAVHDRDELVAEVSRLRAFVIRASPVLAAALELRELGRALDHLEEQMNASSRPPKHGKTRSATPWMMTKQAYDTALTEFDAAVKKAALKEFSDLMAPEQDRGDA